MKPNDQRNFVHKRFIGAVSGFLGGGLGGAVRGFAEGGGRRRGGAPSSAIKADPCPARGTQLGSRGNCYDPRTQNRDGSPKAGAGARAVRLIQEVLPRGRTGREGLEVAIPLTGVKVSTLGGDPRFGAGAGPYQPMQDFQTVRRCLPGDVLGRDGFCYPKGMISNKQRMYPKGRRPLGTPGELAALSKAASFGRRMETTVKRMQKIGVLKKPAPRRIKAPATSHLLGPGPH